MRRAAWAVLAATTLAGGLAFPCSVFNHVDGFESGDTTAWSVPARRIEAAGPRIAGHAPVRPSPR